MKLEKTMLQYVLDKKKIWNNDFNPDLQSNARYIKSTSDYANFLNQTLNISMFIPAKLVDGEWVVLEHPNCIKEKRTAQFYNDKMDEYQQAKENVIFEGFEILDGFKNIIIDRDKKQIFLKYFDIIEDLIPFGLTLNPNLKTLKQLFL